MLRNKMARVELVEDGGSWSGGDDDDLSSKDRRGNIETAVQVYFDYQNNKRQLLFCFVFFPKSKKKRHQKEIKTKPPTISIMKQTRNI